MRAPTQESFWAYRELLREAMRGNAADAGAAESPADYAEGRAPLPLNERLVQCIWAQQLLAGGEMRLADGRPLRVLDPGRWNGAAGPDFKGARLMIGEQTVTGDVEVHLDAGDWAAHGHERDLDYNGVVLHVTLRIDNGRATDRLHNGTEIGRLELEPYVFPDLETLRRSLTPDDFEYARPGYLGRCHRLMTEMDGALLADFLDKAGEERLIAKMRRLEEQADQADLEQVFYQSLMMSLGTGAGKTLYYLLAKRTPLCELMDYAGELPEQQWVTGLEALLLAVAGLLPAEAELVEAPEEARQRAAQLRALWARFEPFWRDRTIPPTRRWFQAIRPPNFPTRRLAGVAVLLARSMRRGRPPLAELMAHLRAGMGSLQGAVPKRRRRHPLLAELVDWFLVGGAGHFWGRHYSFTARPAPRPMTLIGENAALSLLLNALLPAALLVARREDDAALGEAVMRLFGLAPPLQPNHITSFMARRLFGEEERGSGLITTEKRQQGLFQIFYFCCNGEERHCDNCYYLQG